MPEPQDPRVWRRTMAPRLALVAGVFAACVVALVVKLVILQVVWHDHYLSMSKGQMELEKPVPAARGAILDRHGKLLAMSVDAESVTASRVQIKDPVNTAALLCQALGDCDGAREARLAKDLGKGHRYAIVRQRVNPDQARRVRALGIEGVFVAPAGQSRRWYPNRELAAQVLGFVGTSNKGLDGIEAACNSGLSGTPGRALVLRDASQEAFTRLDIGAPPVPGKTLELTIDANLQYLAERVLREGVEENKAVGGSLLVLDPWNGEILAMASYPTYNANLYQEAPEEARRNRPVQFMYEPGSTFKIVTASAALETKVLRPDDLIDTSPGIIRLGSRMVDEYEGHNYGVLSFTDVLVKSSNVGAIKIGFRVGVPEMYRFVDLFGFGSRLSADLPSEARGQVGAPSAWSLDTVMSVSMGYAVNVTALQMASAASVVANGGELVQPHVVRAWIDGNRRTVVPRKVIRRVISAETAAEVTTMMEGVASRGTAKTALTALMKDYSVAGKTGTSNKNDGHRYIEAYNTSFVGFVPSRKPVLTVLVHIDTPRGPKKKAGGAVAAPVFERFADLALRHLGVPPTVNPASPLLVAQRGPSGAPAAVPVSGPAAALTIVPALAPLAAGQIVVPDLRGLSGREALRVLARIGVTPRMTGDGVVTEQEPLPGTPVDIGGTCRLALGRLTAGFQQ